MNRLKKFEKHFFKKIIYLKINEFPYTISFKKQKLTKLHLIPIL